MTAIERAEALLAAADKRCSEECICGAPPPQPCGPHCEYPYPDERALPCTRCSFQRKAEAELRPKRELLRGYIGAVKVLLAEHTLTVDWETNQNGAPIAATLPHYNAFRMGRFTTEGCESCQAIADFERLFSEDRHYC